jgi:hypothetical protein
MRRFAISATVPLLALLLLAVPADAGQTTKAPMRRDVSENAAATLPLVTHPLPQGLIWTLVLQVCQRTRGRPVAPAARSSYVSGDSATGRSRHSDTGVVAFASVIL